MEATLAGLRARERAATALALGALALLTLLAWSRFVGYGAHAGHSPAMHAAPWDASFLATSVAMWSVMMVAMMLPSATPMILAFTRVHCQRAASGAAAVPSALFVSGYVLVWIAWSILAALAQSALQAGDLLDPVTLRSGPLAGSVLLLAAGLFQWSPLKEACLAKCRSPLSLLLTEWREGARGALVMGLRHGAFCAGCCWALMMLMFVGGVMSLAWMGALAIYMLAEKIVPHGRLLSRASGAVLIVAAIAVAAAKLAG